MRTIQDAEASETLRLHFKEGDTVYIIVRSVAKSGMSRRMSFYSITKTGVPVMLDRWVAQAVGLSNRIKSFEGEGISVSGGGMDMGLHVVSNLARRMFGDERALRHRYL